MHHVKNKIPNILISKSTENLNLQKNILLKETTRGGGDKYNPVPHHLHIYPWSSNTWEKHDDEEEDS